MGRAVRLIPQHMAQRVGHYMKHEEEIDWRGLSFPVQLDKIKLFETRNEISVNVYGCDVKKKQCSPYPLRLSKLTETEKHIDLLLLENEEGQSHYCWIKNFSRFAVPSCCLLVVPVGGCVHLWRHRNGSQGGPERRCCLLPGNPWPGPGRGLEERRGESPFWAAGSSKVRSCLLASSGIAAPRNRAVRVAGANRSLALRSASAVCPASNLSRAAARQRAGAAVEQRRRRDAPTRA